MGIVNFGQREKLPPPSSDFIPTVHPFPYLFDRPQTTRARIMVFSGAVIRLPLEFTVDYLDCVGCEEDGRKEVIRSVKDFRPLMQRWLNGIRSTAPTRRRDQRVVID